MSASYIAGLQTACFGMLAIVIVYLFPDRRRELSFDVLLCSAVLLMVAIALTCASTASALVGFEIMTRITGSASVVMDISAAVSLAVFFYRWKTGKRNVNLAAAFMTALVPVWLAGAFWMRTREAALFPIAGTFSLLIIVMFCQRSVEADLKQRAEEVENHQAMVFQWQMRPHFLFNTLHTIRQLMNSDPGLASAGIDNLAGFLRKNLDALTAERMIPFSQELTHIKQYVMLEKMNPANRFEVVYDLQIIDFSLPALSVQPLVENAIRHGVRSLGEEGMVFVTTERHGEMIRIIVEDNGPGFSADRTAQQKENASRGLSNVRRRLETQCGGSMHIQSGKDGTRTIVLIPKRG